MRRFASRIWSSERPSFKASSRRFTPSASWPRRIAATPRQYSASFLRGNSGNRFKVSSRARSAAFQFSARRSARALAKRASPATGSFGHLAAMRRYSARASSSAPAFSCAHARRSASDAVPDDAAASFAAWTAAAISPFFAAESKRAR